MGAEKHLFSFQGPQVRMMYGDSFRIFFKLLLNLHDGIHLWYTLKQYMKNLFDIFTNIEHHIEGDKNREQWIDDRYIKKQQDDAAHKDHRPPQDIFQEMPGDCFLIE